MGNTILLIIVMVAVMVNIWTGLIAYFGMHRKMNLMADILRDMDENIVKAGNHSIAHGEFNSTGIQYVLMATRIYMIANKEQAIRTEYYESVKYYNDAIREIDQLIQTTVKNGTRP